MLAGNMLVLLDQETWGSLSWLFYRQLKLLTESRLLWIMLSTFDNLALNMQFCGQPLNLTNTNILTQNGIYSNMEILIVGNTVQILCYLGMKMN